MVRRDTGDEVPEYIKMTELKDHEHNQAGVRNFLMKIRILSGSSFRTV